MFQIDIERIQKTVVERSDNPKIIDGKKVAKALRRQIREHVNKLKKIDVQPKLVVVIIGEDPASQIYVRYKIKACEETGIDSQLIRLPGDVKKQVLFDTLKNLDADDKVDGILVQFPLPSHLKEEEVMAHIAPSKDVDGFNLENVGKLFAWREGLEPCTPRGIMTLLKVYGIDPKGKRAVVLGRSLVVGRPMAQMLTREHATVSICHRHTDDMRFYVSNADIVVAATGVPHLVPGEWIKPGAAVFDVGITRMDNGKLRGDVDFEACLPHVGHITPVPGGVGPMTVATLLENTIRAATMRRKISLKG